MNDKVGDILKQNDFTEKSSAKLDIDDFLKVLDALDKGKASTFVDKGRRNNAPNTKKYNSPPRNTSTKRLHLPKNMRRQGLRRP